MEIKSLEETLREAQAVMETLAKGKVAKPGKYVVVFPDCKTMRKVLSERRLELLKAVRRHRPKSIYELANLLHRNLRSVQQDVKILSDLGFLELERNPRGKRDRLTPKVAYKKVIFEVDL
ncbi:HTH domain-containing protein [Thermosulfurimonas sp. F29]|uniref:HVO_A0114 family putative DNA-binding protein n=1 Tax=Thermosulfurimonas sp. F29 TaxID=2867247 RepID=UPI001C82C9F2|nr:HTH domain-containing protein [Thermosulfurimonas sp. F29]MBX6422868.1 HTH domain-containing protein [Thermosulfurimonas sp. F29]